MTLLFAFTLLLGFYMAWSIGANDVANAMGTSVGSKALTLRKAVYLAAILEFAGAFFVGSNVSETIQHGIVSPQIFESDPMIFVLGMMGSLLATGILLQVASYYGLPLSTTHAIVGAVVGFGSVIGGMHAVQWDEVFFIAASWILSPLLSGVVSYLMFSLIQKKILYALDPLDAARRLSPFLIFLCFFIASLSFLFQGLKQLTFDFSFSGASMIAAIIGGGASFCGYWFVKKSTPSHTPISTGFHPYQAVSLKKALHHLQRVHLTNRNKQYASEISSVLLAVEDLNHVVRKNTEFSHSTIQYSSVEKMFAYLQILTACLVAFAHGANDVANAIGPVAAILGVLKTNSLSNHAPIPTWLLALGGLGIVFGLATWGWRVIETIGSKITELTPTRGFCAEFGAAFTILFASKLGFPISTTHALVGSVFGVAMARGMQALNLQTLKEIIISWIFTIPLCAAFSILLFYILHFFYRL